MSLLQQPNLNNDSDWKPKDSVPDWRKYTPCKVSPKMSSSEAKGKTWHMMVFNQFFWMLVNDTLTRKYIQMLLSPWNLCPPIHQMGFQLLISDPILCLSCQGQPMTKCCYFQTRPLAQQSSNSIVLLWFLPGLLQVCVNTETHTCHTDQGQTSAFPVLCNNRAIGVLKKHSLGEAQGCCPTMSKSSTCCLLLDKEGTLETTTKLLPPWWFLCLPEKRPLHSPAPCISKTIA